MTNSTAPSVKSVYKAAMSGCRANGHDQDAWRKHALIVESLTGYSFDELRPVKYKAFSIGDRLQIKSCCVRVDRGIYRVFGSLITITHGYC